MGNYNPRDYRYKEKKLIDDSLHMAQVNYIDVRKGDRVKIKEVKKDNMKRQARIIKGVVLQRTRNLLTVKHRYTETFQLKDFLINDYKIEVLNRATRKKAI